LTDFPTIGSEHPRHLPLLAGRVSCRRGATSGDGLRGAASGDGLRGGGSALEAGACCGLISFGRGANDKPICIAGSMGDSGGLE
jgi:hypothetical protein